MGTGHLFQPGASDGEARCARCGKNAMAAWSGAKCTPLSAARRRALTIVAENPRIGATVFARLMWPTSKGHTTRSHRHATPAGGAVGAGIKMRAGVFLNRLADDGLLVRYWNEHRSADYAISDVGRRALGES